ncbi:MAG: hypothetical protein IIC82_01255 [Chloroflexi bacterium]|nr:hypothetical protein [Chloroflexota bacterium]
MHRRPLRLRTGVASSTISAMVAKAPKNTSPEVDVWFERLEHPLKDAMQRVREVILGADARMGECIKWSVPTFAYRG